MNDWRDSALCRGQDPELFFPIGASGPAIVQIEQAKAICRRCPVTDVCLTWAKETGQQSGVWGGLSEQERRVRGRKAKREPIPHWRSSKTHCVHDHPFTGDNVYVDARGRRSCKRCRAIRKSEHAKAQRRESVSS